jgi:hypothetical protein
MSNFKHGFYGKNESLNPDSILIKNAHIKQELNCRKKDIVDVVSGNLVKPGITDLVVYLLDCALPHQAHLLPQEHIDEIWDYYYSSTFHAIAKYNGKKTLQELIDALMY